MPPAAVLAAAAVAGAAQQHSQRTAQRKQKHELTDLTNDQISELNQGLGQQEALQKQANKAGAVGFDANAKDINRYEGAGQEQIGRDAQAAQGNVNANMAQAGLTGSTVGANAQLGVARQSMAAQSELGRIASGMRSQNTLAQGQQKAQGLEKLGQLSAYRANARNAIVQQYWQHIGNQNITSQQPSFGGLGALTSGFGGAAGAGGAAEGAGSAAGAGAAGDVITGAFV